MVGARQGDSSTLAAGSDTPGDGAPLDDALRKLHAGDVAGAEAALAGAGAGAAARLCHARVRLLAGDLAGAERWCEAAAPDAPAAVLLLARVRAERARAANDPATARAELERVLADGEPSGLEGTAAFALLADLAAEAEDAPAAERAATAAAQLAAGAAGDDAQLAHAWAAMAAAAAGVELPCSPVEADAVPDAGTRFRLQTALAERAARDGAPDAAKSAYDKALRVLRTVFSTVPEGDRAHFLQTHVRRRFASNLLRLAADNGGAASAGAPGRVEAQLRGEEDLACFDELLTQWGDGGPTTTLTRLRDRFRDLLRLQEIGMALTAELDVDRLLALIMDRAVEISGAERGFLLLREGGRSRVGIARNVDNENVQRADWKVSHSIADEVARTGLPLITSNARDDQRFDAYGSVHDLGLRSVMCVPLRVRGRVTGTLYLDNRFAEGAFGSETVTMVQAFADHAAVALENARLHQETTRTKAEVEVLNARLAEANTSLAAQVASQSLELDRAKVELRTRASGSHKFGSLVGASAPMQDLFKLLDRVADTDAPVVIEGESGTGKELAARAIHERGPRAGAGFVPENCGAIPESLFESTFFGHVKGAFTGAHRDAPGLFVLADRGTLFLDEIASMTLDQQKKMLRALQESEVRPVGGNDVRKVDVRIVAATNRPLQEMVRAGEFREDLFFRLNVLHVRMPPLRERLDDVPLLVAHFLNVPEERLGDQLTPAALDALCRYHWPGNVRELENVVARMSALASGTLDLEVVPDDLRAAATAGPAAVSTLAGRSLDQLEHEVISAAIREALREAGGVKARAAELLGIPKSSLYNKMKKYGVDG
ncbi:MAG: sigma-54-dependent Fis family transcriptional regulator [Planctomycetota bacterium]